MGTLNRNTSTHAMIFMMAALATVRAKFGLAMEESRAQKLVRHISPADYRSGRKSSGRRPHKQNRLALAYKAKVNRRNAAK